MQDYKYILFDLDGTLVDSGYSITKCAQITLEKYGIIVDDISTLGWFVGPPLIDSFMNRCGMDKETALSAIKDYRALYFGGLMYEVEIYEGIEDTLKRLKSAGMKLAVATSKLEGPSNDILTRIGLRQYFDFIAGDTPEGARGTKAAIIEYACEVAGVTDKSQVLMVGDTQYDMNGALGAGVDGMLVTYGYGDLELAAKAGPRYTVDSAAQIADVVLG